MSKNIIFAGLTVIMLLYIIAQVDANEWERDCITMKDKMCRDNVCDGHCSTQSEKSWYATCMSGN